MRINLFALARKIMSKTLKKDKELYSGYQASITMFLYDQTGAIVFPDGSVKPSMTGDPCGLRVENCNELAKGLIKLIFD